LRIALAQLAAGPDRAANLERCLAAMEKAKSSGADLIAFPEVILDRFFPQRAGDREALSLAEPVPGPTTARLAEHARRLGLTTVFNLYELDPSGQRFDSSPVIDADGSLLGATRMFHITDYEGFHETSYYQPAPPPAAGGRLPVYATRAGRVGVAVCYDRHYPEVMRGLGLAGAELVVIPQAGTAGEWPEGLFEAEVRTAAFQNGYFAALVNRVGREDRLDFSGESFVVDPEGRVVARARSGTEDLLLADVDLARCADSTARRLFWRDRRPELYSGWS
jgi:beta-ureidopropionase